MFGKMKISIDNLKNNKMFKFSLVATFIILIATCGMEAQFNQQVNRSLFSDPKAFKQDDALMILIVEETQANNGASNTESRSNDLSGGLNATSGYSGFQGDLGIKTGNTFKSDGKTTRSESIRSRLSARVIGVQPNGNLQIEGKRSSKVNEETQTITISGIVRPVDIRSDNTVYSYSILDLTLTIEGSGNITKTQEPGYITKFLRILF
ncbi:MAG: flgH [Ignavibacteria bacterium]|nr:flgH [Ignavibacteria bacterium]